MCLCIKNYRPDTLCQYLGTLRDLSLRLEEMCKGNMNKREREKGMY